MKYGYPALASTANPWEAPVEPDVWPADPPHAVGTHVVTAVIVDADGKTLYAQATIGEDCHDAGQFVIFREFATDAPDPELAAWFWADGCNVGAVLASGHLDRHGSLAVSYDGARVFGQGHLDFFRGVANTTIRYGAHQPTWTPLDRGLFPNYPALAPGQRLLPPNVDALDFSFNGLGVATTSEMSMTGMRDDIAYLPQWLVPHVVDPTNDTYAIVRKCADSSGCWPIYFVSDTGDILDIETYPGVSTLPSIQMSPTAQAANPIKLYQNDPARWGITGTKYVWDCAHQTAYNFVAAATTGSARDRFHASVHAQAVLSYLNPSYRAKSHIWCGQERASAWSLRSLFLASRVSAHTEYFTRQLDKALAMYPFTGKLGYLGTQVDRVFKDGSKGTAPWEENYARLVIGVVAHALLAWQPVADHLNRWITTILSMPQFPQAAAYTLGCANPDTSEKLVQDAAGNPDYAASMRAAIGSTLDDLGYSAADIAAYNAPDATPQQLHDLTLKYNPNYSGQPGDFLDYVTSSDGYPAIMRAAVAANFPAISPEWQRCEGVPTKPNWEKGWAWNVVPYA